MTSNSTEAVEQPKTNENNTDKTIQDGKKEDDLKKDGPDSTDEKKVTEDASTGSPTKKPREIKPSVHKTDFDKDVVYLYQFSRCPTVPSASPYCLKVETWLRMAGIKYENIDHKMKFKSKKGQLPFVEINGKEIADSDIIIKELSAQFQKDIDEGLTEEQRTISHGFESMLNNHTSWVVRWWRYNNPGEFITVSQMDLKRTLNSRIPKGMLHFFFKIGFKSNVKQVVQHGLGRHSNEEILEFGKEDLLSLSKQLGDHEYFFGKEPHLLDCTAFAHLCQFFYVPFEGMKDWMEKETPNLCKFVNRMKERWWTDWDEACNSLELNTHLPKKEPTEDDKKAEEAKEEAKRKKEELKKQKEEQKKEKEEKKKKEREEKEQKKREAKEKAEKEKAEKLEREKAEKEKAEKEKAEKEAKEKAEKEEKEKAAAESKTEEEKTKESDTKAEAAEPENKTTTSKEEEKK